MSLTPEWKGRIDRWKKELEKQFYIPLGNISMKGFTTFQQFSAETAAQMEFIPMQKDTKWGAKWEYGWFIGDIILPTEALQKKIVLNINVGGESTVYINRKILGTVRADWVPEKHHFISDLCLCESGIPNNKYEILIECYSGHGLRMCDVGPVPPGRLAIPEPGETQVEVGESTYGIWNEYAYQLWLDVKMLLDIRNNIEPNSLRSSEIDKGLKDFTLIVDFEQPHEDMVESFKQCRERLQTLMECKNGSTTPTMYMFGHSHIDIVWLWSLAETERKCGRTLSTQLEHLDKYPEYVFLQSQPYLYQLTKKLYPEIYKRIKEKVKEGRFIPEGGMWVEADTNITGGESLIRQFIHGKRFFREEFGVENELLWLPDVFGYTASLPQIMKGCGIKYFSTSKIFWNYNGGEPFPYNYFMWQGIDGSEIISFFHCDYNSFTSADAVIKRWNERAQKDGISQFLFPFGYGDGGGGPTRDHIENTLRLRDIEGAPKVKMSSPIDFFKELEKVGKRPENKYVGELYLQYHRGVLTSQAKTKKGNRMCELGLREAEMWSAVAGLRNNFEYPFERMDEAWKIVLMNQFHDLLPGSSIARVYEEAEVAYQEVIKLAKDMAFDAVEKLCCSKEGLTVFNSLSWDRSELVELPDGWSSAVDDSGNALKVQQDGGKNYADVLVPSCGWTSIKANETRISLVNIGIAGDKVLENEHLKVLFTSKGEISSIYDKDSSMELSAGSCNSFKMYKDVPRIHDAWDIDSVYEMSEVELNEDSEFQVLCSGPLKGTIKINRRLNNSTLTQYVSLKSGSRRIDFETEINWDECHKLLKVAFPVNIYADEAVHEIQFGHLSRPNHRSRQYDVDRFEVSNHKWSALMEANRGVAIMNDCKYGVNVLGNSINLSLLRAPKAPDPNADIGMQKFTYSFYAWNGAFIDSDVIKEAYQLNIPPLVINGYAGTHSMFSLDADNIIMEAAKTAEDRSGDIIIRLYECKRATVRCTLKIQMPILGVEQTNMLEEFEKEIEIHNGEIPLEFKPFEIKTIRIKVEN